MGRHKKSLEDAINNITSGTILDNIIKQTTKDVAKKVKKDMKEKAKEAVKHYYESYDPKSYDRLSPGALYHSYRVIDESSDGRVNVSLIFDPELINKEHRSTSKYHQSGDVWNSIKWGSEIPSGDNYGMPEGSFILSTFWYGQHPIFTGNKYTGFEWNPVTDSVTPQDIFENFINNTYVEKVLSPYANEILTNRVLDALRKQFN